MKKKIRYLLFIIVLCSLFYVINGSYAMYKSTTHGSVSSIPLAKFVFNDQLTDTLSFDIKDMKPGTVKQFNFQVTNANASNRSDVVIKYKFFVNSYSLPLQYSIVLGSNTTNLLTCSGTVDISCSSSYITMNYTSNITRSYTLKVSFPSTNSSGDVFGYNYSNNIDTVTLRIESIQST